MIGQIIKRSFRYFALLNLEDDFVVFRRLLVFLQRPESGRRRFFTLTKSCGCVGATLTPLLQSDNSLSCRTMTRYYTSCLRVKRFAGNCRLPSASRTGDLSRCSSPALRHTGLAFLAPAAWTLPTYARGPSRRHKHVNQGETYAFSHIARIEAVSEVREPSVQLEEARRKL
jgi:hypothetical protein